MYEHTTGSECERERKDEENSLQGSDGPKKEKTRPYDWPACRKRLEINLFATRSDYCQPLSLFVVTPSNMSSDSKPLNPPPPPAPPAYDTYQQQVYFILLLLCCFDVLRNV